MALWAIESLRYVHMCIWLFDVHPYIHTYTYRSFSAHKRPPVNHSCGRQPTSHEKMSETYIGTYNFDCNSNSKKVATKGDAAGICLLHKFGSVICHSEQHATSERTPRRCATYHNWKRVEYALSAACTPRPHKSTARQCNALLLNSLLHSRCSKWWVCY